MSGHSVEAMRTEVEFDAEGVKLRGWLYRPDGAGTSPAVVMFHGLSALKEMCLDQYAEVFAEAGIAVLLLDNRNFGASDGEPRQELDPWVQVRDYRHAITYATTIPDIDPDRIGVFGLSVSGGHTLVVPAIDRRVRCAVSLVPMVSGSGTVTALVRSDFQAQVRAQFDQDRLARYQGKEPAMIAVVSPDPLLPCVSPTADAWEWFSETGRTRAPAWRNEVTLRSLEMLSEYEPAAYIRRISPTPLLMIVAEGDHLLPSQLAIAAYEEALEPKCLVILPGGHFEVYTNRFDAASSAARDWFVEHLRPEEAGPAFVEGRHAARATSEEVIQAEVGTPPGEPVAPVGARGATVDAGRDTVLGPRQPLGTIVLDDGTRHALHRSYVIGREPEQDPAVQADEALPLRLEDPEQLVSRVHADIRLMGGEVQVVDRGSANGTYVLAPEASEWQRLASGQPHTIRPGARIAIGRKVLTCEW